MRCGHLEVLAAARRDRDAAALALDQPGVIGGACQHLAIDAKRLLQRPASEDLGGLHRPQRPALERLTHERRLAAAAIAPVTPALRASAITCSASSAETSGRAPSWISASSLAPAASSALRADSERLAPPATQRSGVRCATLARRSSTSPPSAAEGSATTISAIDGAAASANSDHSISALPPSCTSALGQPAPRRSPEPAPSSSATASAGSPIPRTCERALLARRDLLARLAAREQLVEVDLDLLLVLVERIHQLGGEDLLRPRVHLLLARRESLLVVAQRQVAHDLCELVDVSRLDLLAVVLEATVPVLWHVRDIALEDLKHLLDGFLVDHAPQARQPGVLGRDLHRHVVVQDLDRQVLALFAQHLDHFLALDLARSVVRVDHVVAKLKIDQLGAHANLIPFLHQRRFI